MLEKFQSLPPEKQTENMASAFGDGMDQMVNYVYDHYDNFKLLLRCSDNGKYGDMTVSYTHLTLPTTSRV